MTAVRSPNYPAISLPEAIKRVELVYKQEQRHAADKEVIAKAIGYGSLNGGSTVVISALTKYGLLEPAGKGDQLKISGDALDILIHNTGEFERMKAVRKTAFMPSLFNELYETYRLDLPSDHSLRATLLKKGFNQKTVDSVIRSYRDTIEFVNAENQDPIMESLEEEQAEIAMQTQAIRSNNTGPGINQKSVMPVPSHSLGEKDFGESVVGFKLTEECGARIEFLGEVTQEAINKLIKHLELSMDAYPTRASLDQKTAHHENEE